MNTTYPVKILSRIFRVDSSKAVEELSSLCRVKNVQFYALWILARGFRKDKALKNLDFLFSEHKKDFHFSSDVFCNRFRDVLNWGLKHLLSFVSPVESDEYFPASYVECYSKEDNYKDALDLLDYWRKERQKVEAGEAVNQKNDLLEYFFKGNLKVYNEFLRECWETNSQSERVRIYVKYKKAGKALDFVGKQERLYNAMKEQRLLSKIALGTFNNNLY